MKRRNHIAVEVAQVSDRFLRVDGLFDHRSADADGIGFRVHILHNDRQEEAGGCQILLIVAIDRFFHLGQAGIAAVD